ncbi:GlsB/YeaQ/YmgE family stress response membrane protein [Micropruina sp.]|uniref:GlsB/YeaQ/YmgE family stress response membrane protein n=1 Tax=Micropruina sp. TaxID=2737536 RepID=UPI0039E2C985
MFGRPGSNPKENIIVGIVGIVGGLLGGWLLDLFGIGGGGWVFSMLTAIGGAVLLLWIGGAVAGRRSA